MGWGGMNEDFSGKTTQENSTFVTAKGFHGKIQASLKEVIPSKRKKVQTQP